jgi:membrane protease subunit HflC
MLRRSLLIALSFVLLWCLYSSILFVEQTEYAYVTQFGRHVVTYDGATESGLQWKLPWPIQSVTRLDRRLLLYEVPGQEFLIRDRDETNTEKPLPLTFDFFLTWRIGAAGEQAEGHAQAVDNFVRRFGTPERAQVFLRTQIISRLKAEMSSLSLAQIINTDATKLEFRPMLEKVRRELAERTAEAGIVIVDVGVRRFNHPLQVRDQIFEKIKADRKREANNYRIQGEEKAAEILAKGAQEVNRIQAETQAEKLRLEGQADADATRILNEAHRHDPELYRLLRLIRAYRQMFADDRTQLILSLDHPLLSLFREVPGMKKTEPPTIPPVEKK